MELDTFFLLILKICNKSNNSFFKKQSSSVQKEHAVIAKELLGQVAWVGILAMTLDSLRLWFLIWNGDSDGTYLRDCHKDSMS